MNNSAIHCVPRLLADLRKVSRVSVVLQKAMLGHASCVLPQLCKMNILLSGQAL